MNYSIKVNDISKFYYAKKNRTELLKLLFLPFLSIKKEPKYVLKNINFKVNKGESIALVGMNGAGKSTLLKIISGVVFPSSGNIEFSGRVVALLELGMGLHPEFSGRDNIKFASQLIGISNKELESLYNDIIEFAEIGDYIDAPVRTYSSGMQIRLAFSIATAIRPDILIIDEALSVGDAYFQQKSFKKIREYREQGTTLLFVSHDKSSVLSLCDRAILLDKGQIIMNDSPAIVMDYYNSLIAKKNEQDTICQDIKDNLVRTESGSRDVYFTNIELLNENNESIECVKVGEKVKLSVDIESTIDIDSLVYGFLIKERTGLDVFGTNTYNKNKDISMVAGVNKHIDIIFEANLGPGLYSISVALHVGKSHIENNYHWIDLAVTFTVINASKDDFIGVNYIDTTFII